METEMDSVNARTGHSRSTGLDEFDAKAVDASVSAAARAWRKVERLDRSWWAGLLHELSNALAAEADVLAPIADRETALGLDRLRGEVHRSANQFALFEAVVREGSYLEAIVDHATVEPPAADIRRMLIPLGVVAVFGASNFPFAFSVAGGDTASALAAGNSVVIKAHESHLETSRATHRVLTNAAVEYGAPADLISIVYGRAAGVHLIEHPDVAAVGFTGSVRAGRALLDAIARRPDPIPFYGELSSINPVLVTPLAAQVRSAAIAEALHGSFTTGAGQFCTKPGLAFVPSGAAGDLLIDRLSELTVATPPQVLLNDPIRSSYLGSADDLIAGGALRVATGAEDGNGLGVAAGIYETELEGFVPERANEVFGPVMIVVRYHDVNDALGSVERVPRSLTATLHHEADDSNWAAKFTQRMRSRAGRIVFNDVPTGVRVSWAQHHGGPWPATNSVHTSVGATAIRRFLRPVAFQSAPEVVLPPELRDGETTIPRRVDGTSQPGSPARYGG